MNTRTRTALKWASLGAAIAAGIGVGVAIDWMATHLTRAQWVCVACVILATLSILGGRAPGLHTDHEVGKIHHPAADTARDWIIPTTLTAVIVRVAWLLWYDIEQAGWTILTVLVIDWIIAATIRRVALTRHLRATRHLNHPRTAPSAGHDRGGQGKLDTTTTRNDEGNR
jgi:hypothetical protein